MTLTGTALAWFAVIGILIIANAALYRYQRRHRRDPARFMPSRELRRTFERNEDPYRDIWQ
jgi:hypothetical protein